MQRNGRKAAFRKCGMAIFRPKSMLMPLWALALYQ